MHTCFSYYCIASPVQWNKSVFFLSPNFNKWNAIHHLTIMTQSIGYWSNCKSNRIKKHEYYPQMESNTNIGYFLSYIWKHYYKYIDCHKQQCKISWLSIILSWSIKAYKIRTCQKSFSPVLCSISKGSLPL